MLLEASAEDDSCGFGESVRDDPVTRMFSDGRAATSWLCNKGWSCGLLVPGSCVAGSAAIEAWLSGAASPIGADTIL